MLHFQCDSHMFGDNMSNMCIVTLGVETLFNTQIKEQYLSLYALITTGWKHYIEVNETHNETMTMSTFQYV